LLWLSWRGVRFDPLTKTSPTTLVATLKRAQPTRVQQWHYLAVLAAVLLLRAIIYWQLGGSLGWTPSLYLGAIAVPFRSDFLKLTILFSLLSFALALFVFYLWLLLLSIVNGQAPDAEPLQKFVRLHLGWIDRFPWPVKLALPLAVTLLLWYLISMLLAGWQIIPAPASSDLRLKQGVVIGLGGYLSWKYVIGAFLALCLVNTYVYLGEHPFWNFVSVTGRKLVRPLQPLHLRIGKVDFAPVIGIAIVFLAAEFAQRKLTVLYQHFPQ
jgi:uncharacterized protein YggT (Ycf19 family)